jgi:ribosomal protein S1
VYFTITASAGAGGTISAPGVTTVPYDGGFAYTITPFRIIEFAQDGRKFVVSRRAVLEEEQKKRADEMRRLLAVDQIVTGRVVSVRDFGAFVDIGGGVQGLLHVSEMGWSRVNDPTQMFKPGDEVTVKVLRIEAGPRGGEEKIALGLRQLTDDPWSTVPAKYPAGRTVRGRVSRVAEFGVFVELEPGVIGLMPAAESGTAKGTDLKKLFPVGTEVDVLVLEVDLAGRRLRFSIQAIRDEAEKADVRDYAARAGADAGSSSLGSLADKLRGALGSRDE